MLSKSFHLCQSIFSLALCQLIYLNCKLRGRDFLLRHRYSAKHTGPFISVGVSRHYNNVVQKVNASKVGRMSYWMSALEQIWSAPQTSCIKQFSIQLCCSGELGFSSFSFTITIFKQYGFKIIKSPDTEIGALTPLGHCMDVSWPLRISRPLQIFLRIPCWFTSLLCRLCLRHTFTNCFLSSHASLESILPSPHTLYWAKGRESWYPPAIKCTLTTIFLTNSRKNGIWCLFAVM